MQLQILLQFESDVQDCCLLAHDPGPTWSKKKNGNRFANPVIAGIISIGVVNSSVFSLPLLKSP
jgi:hypothetical protein